MPTKQTPMFATTTDRKGNTHHFFASSLQEWKVSDDVAALIDHFKRKKWPFNLWFVPGPTTTPYEIEYYAPQIDGARWIAFYDVKKHTPEAK